MIKVNEIAFVGYPVTDLPRARAFYEGIIHLTPSMVHESEDKKTGWVEYDIASGTFAIACMADGQWLPSSSGPSCAFEVEDFDHAIASLREAGVTFKFEPFESPVCHMALVSDPDGNLVTIHKRKAPAAS